MHLTWRDAAATVFVGTAVAAYVLWNSGTAVPDLSVRAIGGIVLALGWLGCVTNQREMAVVFGVDRTAHRPTMLYIVAVSALGAATLVAGVVTVVTGKESALVVLVAATVVLWTFTTIRHAER
jgi:hypothetical protein